MIKFTNATDGREDLIKYQYNEVEKNIRLIRMNGYTDVDCHGELLPEVTAALLLAGYDVTVFRDKNGRGGSTVSWSIKREKGDGKALINFEIGAKHEKEYSDQVVAAINAMKKAPIKQSVDNQK